ncbi:DUF4102 domain-containing protein [Pseudoalteromonas rubra]|uniref:DUF4102 domain-containing protein n=1 Tax=Pseudoalteromonas rubra TaxID=43658 RepID=A0A5S3UVP5_9GAMM|nr:site-specific integrase [Pseudoalteromonas rubra]QPB84562.1 DUF4102 domain-containing protein [Pseudoalteromonas rubra]
MDAQKWLLKWLLFLAVPDFVQIRQLLCEDKMLSDSKLKSLLKQGDQITSLSDSGGLIFLISKAGKANFSFRYQLHGKRSKISIGNYPTLSLKDARNKAAELRHLIACGTDPLIEKRKKANQHRNTLNAIFDHYYDTIVEPRYSHPKRLHSIYNNNIRPSLGNRPIDTIGGLELSNLLQKIKKGHGKAAPRSSIASKTLYLLKRLYTHAVKLDLIRHNLALSFTAIDAGGEEKPKDIFLTEQQISEFFLMALEAGPSFSRENYLACAILFCTCVRKMELLAAIWEEFDLEGKCWTIPAIRTKSRRELLVPLTPCVIKWLKELKVCAADSDYVFPARKQSKKPHVYHDTLNHAIAGLSLPFTFAPYDIRRSGRTLLAQLGVNDQIGELCLNHKLPKMQHIYNKHSFFHEKSAALTRLSEVICPCMA